MYVSAYGDTTVTLLLLVRLSPRHCGVVHVCASAALPCWCARLNDPPPQLQPSSCLGRYVDVWAPICRGDNPPVEQILGESAAAAGLAAAVTAAAAEQVTGGSCISYSAGVDSSRGLQGRGFSGSLTEQHQQHFGLEAFSSAAAAATAAELAAFEKGLKQRVMLAVDHFNKDYKKGFQFLQVGLGAL